MLLSVSARVSDHARVAPRWWPRAPCKPHPTPRRRRQETSVPCLALTTTRREARVRSPQSSARSNPPFRSPLLWLGSHVAGSPLLSHSTPPVAALAGRSHNTRTHAHTHTQERTPQLGRPSARAALAARRLALRGPPRHACSSQPLSRPSRGSGASVVSPAPHHHVRAGRPKGGPPVGAAGYQVVGRAHGYACTHTYTNLPPHPRSPAHPNDVPDMNKRVGPPSGAHVGGGLCSRKDEGETWPSLLWHTRTVHRHLAHSMLEAPPPRGWHGA